jgi:hypothetical protein
MASQHETTTTTTTRRPHGTSPADLKGKCRVARLLIDCRAQRVADPLGQRRRHTLSSLSASALSTRAAANIFSRDFLTPHSISLYLSPLVHCAFAGAGSLATLPSPRVHTHYIRLFALDRSSTASGIRHKLLQCPRRREARCRAARSRRPRHRMYIMQAASQRG